jgi:hypothetical protein
MIDGPLHLCWQEQSKQQGHQLPIGDPTGCRKIVNTKNQLCRQPFRTTGTHRSTPGIPLSVSHLSVELQRLVNQERPACNPSSFGVAGSGLVLIFAGGGGGGVGSGPSFSRELSWIAERGADSVCIWRDCGYRLNLSQRCADAETSPGRVPTVGWRFHWFVPGNALSCTDGFETADGRKRRVVDVSPDNGDATTWPASGGRWRGVRRQHKKVFTSQ